MPAWTNLLGPSSTSPFVQREGYGYGTSYIMLRSAQSPVALTSAVRRELRDLEPAAPLSNVRSMEESITASQSRPRFLTLLLSIFSAVALTLAVVGIYGVLSYLVAQRGKEFGLRLALGAPRGHVLGLVLKQGALLAIVGLGAGLIASLALTRLMSTLLYGIRATDPVTFVVMPAALGAAALAASLLPAHRATKVDPMMTLRYE